MVVVSMTVRFGRVTIQFVGLPLATITAGLEGRLGNSWPTAEASWRQNHRAAQSLFPWQTSVVRHV
jgi:hypothetical protein